MHILHDWVDETTAAVNHIAPVPQKTVAQPPAESKPTAGGSAGAAPAS